MEDFPSGTSRHFPPVPELRETFADFLERLAAGPRPPADWAEHVATHYADSGLEWLRREVARRGGEFCAVELPGARRAELLAWAHQLRGRAT